MKPTASIRFRPAKRGFALIVTLSLMILLTVIAIGLLTLSSISLRSSSQGESATIARANARLALMMAIGELQKEMGPDSRISAPNDASPTPPSGGQSRWTAVYDAWKWNADAASPETPLTRTPKFRGWLVSGANVANGGPAGTGEFATLVGPTSLPASAKVQDQIKAPMLALSSGNRRGSIAWWSSDESVKAKITAGGDTLASKPLSDSQSPPHVGHKAIDQLSALNWKPGQRASSASTAEVNLAAELGATGLGRLNHDVTVNSAGVLADVRQGRLKLDLSNLLSRPIAELMNKPLYVADGRINRFQIASDGSLTNATWLPVNSSGANRWGINLEELHLFHEIHREVDWSNGKPRLVNKDSRTAVSNDRFFIYRKPTLEAVSVILFLIASPEAGSAPTTYRMDASMDTIVALSNPNDIPTVWPASLNYLVETEGFPYRPKWNISRPGRVPAVPAITRLVQPINSGFFRATLKNGFTLEPGEGAVFGVSETDTQALQVNLTRGYAPRGGVLLDDLTAWNQSNARPPDPAIHGLGATGLRATDIMDFSMQPQSTGLGSTPSGWISTYAKVSDASGATTVAIHQLGGGGSIPMTTAPMNTYLPASITPSQKPTIQNFIGKPLPVVMVTTLCNVERSRTALTPPNALPSRPYQLHEPATSGKFAITNGASNILPTMQNSQLLTIAEPMDFAIGNDRTMADSTGRNIYHGGAREPGLGGSKSVVKRRIPLTAPGPLH